MKNNAHNLILQFVAGAVMTNTIGGGVLVAARKSATPQSGGYFFIHMKP